MTLKACRNCNRITDASTCPNCTSTSLSDDWTGYVVVINPNDSEIAKRLNIAKEGKYALRVR